MIFWFNEGENKYVNLHQLNIYYDQQIQNN
jgi:hypothetical protein